MELAEALVEILDGPNQRDRLVCVWKFCHDESSDMGQKGLFVAAAAMAPLKKWRAFYRKWNRALAGRPSIDYFHMSEATTRDRPHKKDKKNQFQGWTDDDVDKKADRLAVALSKTIAWRAVSEFDLDEYWSVMNASSIPKNYKDPYLLGFFSCLELVAQHMRSLGGEQKKPILIFDNWTDPKREARARHIYACVIAAKPEHGTLYEVARWLPPQVEFLDDVDGDIGLQAADLVVWNWRRSLGDARRTGIFDLKPIHGRDAWGQRVGIERIQNWERTMLGFTDEIRANLGLP